MSDPKSRLLLTVLLLATSETAFVGERPAALLAAGYSRSHAALRTGRVDWTETRYTEGEKDHIRNYSSQFAGEDFTLIDRGDPNGVTLHNLDGAPALQYVYKGPRNYLVRGDKLWIHLSDTAWAEVRPAEFAASRNILDIRGCGINTWRTSETLYDRMQNFGENSLEWDSRVEDGVHVVTATMDAGKLQWWIDSRKDWNPIRIVATDPQGNIQTDTRISLQLRGDNWFPEYISKYRDSYRGGLEPFDVLHVTHADFNNPDDPTALTPAHIGVEVGMGVNDYTQPGVPLQYWDGEQAVRFDELVKRMNAGELKYGPVMSNLIKNTPVVPLNSVLAPDGTIDGERLGRGYLMPNALEDVMSDWELYTHVFIRKYGLDDEQMQKALQILKECQELSSRRFIKHKAEHDAFEKLANSYKDAPASKKAELLASIQKEFQRLKAPFDDMFENALKSRLELLPTRAQRESAEKQSTESPEDIILHNKP